MNSEKVTDGASVPESVYISGELPKSGLQGSMGIGLLFDFYGELLTERQRELSEYCFIDDLSLREISELTGITRQGVRAALEKSKALLEHYENRLGLARRFMSARTETKRLTDISERISKSASGGDNPGLSALSDELRESAERLGRLYET